MTTLCFDIGGTKCLAALADARGGSVQLVDEQRHETNIAAGADAIRTWMLECIAQWQGRFDSIGVGFGGPVDYATQTVVRSVHVPGWENFSLAQWLSDAAGVPAVIDNDANVGALGEYAALRANATSSPSVNALDPFVYMTLSTGIGSAIIVDGSG